MKRESGILIRRGGPGAAWTAPETTAYEAEAHLQAVLAASPGWLPGVSDQAFTVRELSTTAGYVDICVVDVDGSLTVVECKLASNSEKRRLVIGQVLDYAAALWRDGEQIFLEAWQRVGGPDLSEELTAAALADLRRHLADGQINLCLAVDSIDADLRRLVEYLNLVTLPAVSVTAVQLSYARDGDVEILIPTSFGGEIADAKVAPMARPDQWTRDAFLEALGDANDRATAEWLLARLDATGTGSGHDELVWFGARPNGGVFLHPAGCKYSPLQLWVNTAGTLMAYGNWKQYGAIKAHPGFAELAAMLGQDHRGPQRSVPVAPLNREHLWSAVVRCAAAINTPTTQQATPSSAGSSESPSR